MIEIMGNLSYNISIQFGFLWKGGRMGNKQKVTITLDEAILKEIDRFSKEQGESRSNVIEEAIREWKQKHLEDELIKGYTSMAKEDLETAEANLGAGTEAIK
jgi:metal-responsive CopG/Arc/MetJ family transcriptional regulator